VAPDAEGHEPSRPPPDQQDAGGIFNRRTILRGMTLFLVITVAAMTGLFLYTNTGVSLSALDDLRPAFLLIIIPLVFLDLLLGALRIHVFVRKLNRSARLWLSFRANLGNIFMGAMTPSQTGGGPAQLYILHQGGISIAKGMSLGIINFLSTILVFVLAAGFSLAFLGNSFSSTLVNRLVVAGFIVFCLQLAWVLTAILRPTIFEKLFRGLARAFSRMPLITGRVHRLENWFTGFIASYRDTCGFFFRKEPAIVVQSFLMTAVLYLNKFTIAWLLMKGIGGHGAYIDVVAIHMLIYFISYFAPSPGASGVAELSTAALMSSILPRGLLPIFALLQRFFLLYIPVALGVPIVLSAIRRRSAPPGEGGAP
jgi:glycosyltransferase 2 family protein